MKKSFLLLVILSGIALSYGFLGNQIEQVKSPFHGAWQTQFEDENGNLIEVQVILQDSFIAETFYNETKKKFYSTLGGTWEDDGTTFTMNIRFHSDDPKAVGTKITLEYSFNGDILNFKGDPKDWIRIDDGSQSEMANAWFFSGRQRNGEMSRRAMSPRKTMKILSSTRFQWIAYNDATAAFFGTGGGDYTAENGRYTENINFFSRDSSRVGASLGFDYEIIDGEWHHSGFSSKGAPMYEIWAPYGMVLKNPSN